MGYVGGKEARWALREEDWYGVWHVGGELVEVGVGGESDRQDGPHPHWEYLDCCCVVVT